MADTTDKPRDKSEGGTDIETKKLFSLSLTIVQIWSLAVICATAIAGTFGLGVFFQKTISDSSYFVKEQELAKATSKAQDLERTINALNSNLELTIAQRQALETKSELLNRLVSYLQSHDEVSKKLLIDVVCSMWKESEKTNITLSRERIKIDPQELSKPLSPDIERLLISRGVSQDLLNHLKQPIRTGSSRIGPFTIASVQPQISIAEREEAVGQVLKQTTGVEVIKIISFSDGSRYQMPQEIAVAVHLNPSCAP